MLELNPLDHPVCLTVPRRLTPHSAWHEHIPFAMWLVDVLRPKIIVELGTQYGDSYCAFCQAVQELKLNTLCYAIDTWQGDPHTGFYGHEVLAHLRAHHDLLYGSFSRLIQSTFDEALPHFTDGTVDLLHIDGYHTYESVKHDFESWLPKVSSRGIVLFHDINVRERDFGVRRFWDEVKGKYPHFEFLHCHGLGVLAVGKVPSRELKALLETNEEGAGTIRNFFFQLGVRLTMAAHDKVKESQIAELSSLVQAKDSQIRNLETQIQQIQRGIVMQLVSRYQRVVEKLLRPGTRRRYYYELALTGIRVILNEGWKSFWCKFRLWKRQASEVKKGFALRQVSERKKPSDLRYKTNKNEWYKSGSKFTIHIADPQNAIVLVSHDARAGGASLLALHMARTMREKFNKELVIILLQGGPLESSFKQFGDVFCLQLTHFGSLDNPEQANGLVAALRHSGIRYCITNTAVSGCLVPLFRKYGFYIVSLIHELPTSIEMLGVRDSAKSIMQCSNKIIYASDFVKRQLSEYYGDPGERAIIKPQGVYITISQSANREKARQVLRRRLKAGKDSFIFLGCGQADLRKGIDLFINVAGLVLKKLPHKDIHFLWLGGVVDNTLKTWVEHDIARLNAKDRIHLLNYTSDTMPIYIGSDAFLLTSREDPFPAVFQIAMDAGLPVIAFENAGGAPDALKDGHGIVVPYMDTASMADAAVELVLNEYKRQNIAEKAIQLAKQDYDFEKYVGFLLDLFSKSEYPSGDVPSQHALKLKPVSVIIPNYNYARYLPERLQSIVNQTYKPYEIIFLDDASTDNSIEVARHILQGSGIKFSIIENKVNEGVFNQWVKGFHLAEGDLVWLAEADDYCEPDFLEKLVPRFDDDRVTLAYTQSQVIDEKPQIIDYSYTSYTADLSPNKWNSDYCQSGTLEINDGLAIKNTIPNASAVVIRKSALAGIEDTLGQFRICGDWFTYLYALKNGKISFCHQPLNYHRRHSQSVINMSEKTELFFKEILAIQEFILRNYTVRSSVWEKMKTHLEAEYRRLGCQGYKSRNIMHNPNLASKLKNLNELAFEQTLKQSRKHKIMIIIPDLEFGGGQVFGIRLANFLSATNDIFLYNARPYLINVEIKEIISANVRLCEGNGSPDEVKQIIDTHGIDTVISNVWWADKLAYFAVKDRKVKWILVMHGCYEALVANPHWDNDFTQLVRPILARADRIVYTAEKNLKAIESLGLRLKNSPVKINNGFLKPVGFATKNRAELGVNANDFVFGLISRAIPEKGWEQAIIATIKLNEVLDNRRVHLFLIGESDYAKRLRRKYMKEDVIHFVGFQANLSEWISMFDAGLLPSYFQSESQPLTIIEFLAHKKPVIATDIGEIRSMLIRGDKQAGIVLPIVDGTIKVDDLFLAMKRLALNEDHIYDSLRNNCEELFLPYNMKTCAAAYIDLIEK